MKKVLLVLVILLVFPVVGLAASGDYPLHFEVGTSIGNTVLTAERIFEFGDSIDGDDSGLLTILIFSLVASSRCSISGNVNYEINDFLRFGSELELGYAFFNFTELESRDALPHAPIRIFGRAQLGALAIDPYVGVDVMNIMRNQASYPNCLEYGVKLHLGKLVIHGGVESWDNNTDLYIGLGSQYELF